MELSSNLMAAPADLKDHTIVHLLNHGKSAQRLTLLKWSNKITIRKQLSFPAVDLTLYSAGKDGVGCEMPVW